MLVLAALSVACDRDSGAAAPASTPATPPYPTVEGTRAATAIATRAALGDDARALLRVVSKGDPLPGGHVPEDLVPLPRSATAPTAGTASLSRTTADALLEMFASAAGAGLDIRVVSAYRSYDAQAEVHGRLADRVGAAQAARRSAPPGHSEHQLGTTADLSAASVGWVLSARFAATAEGVWLREHAHEFGFALSYPADGEAVTGYIFEPWHFRFIGREAAERWRSSGQPLLLFLRAEYAAEQH